MNEELEKRVTERTMELQIANKELEAFSYSVSHDLRAPLRAIDGFSRILIEEYQEKLDPEGRRICKVISDNTRKMDQLIDDLLAFSRFGSTEMQCSDIDMTMLANSVFIETTNKNERGKISFTVSQLPQTKGDLNLIKQVWVNLISNAVKFSSTRELPVITIGCKEEDNSYVYYIRDNGVGFNMRYEDKLFKVFQRLHDIKKFKGTGVGLALVKQIINRHDGKVWAVGEIDKGATIYFSLPKDDILSK
jgi:light-regulated signal transduction histidine kinase (bacteriophytochrome)